MFSHKKCFIWAFFTFLAFFPATVWSVERENARIHDISFRKPNSHAVAGKINRSDLLKQVLGLSDDDDLVISKVFADLRGNKHTRYRQFYKGLPIWGEQVITHEDSKGILRTTGFLIKGLEKTAMASAIGQSAILPTDEILSIAIQSKGHDYTNWSIQNVNIEKVIFLDNDLAPIEAYSVNYFAGPKSVVVNTPPLINSVDEPARPFFIIDANSGVILKEWEGLAHAEIGTGPGGNLKTGEYEYGVDYDFLDVEQSDSTCIMENANVKTVNLNHGTSGSGAFSYTCPRNTTKYINGAYSPLNDAHFFGGAGI